MVIIPKDNVTIGSWTGEGYIVINPETGEAEYLLYGDVDKCINGGISGFVIGISLIVALFVSPLLIAALAYGVEFLFELYAIGMIDEFVLVFDLYCLGEVADEIKTDWEIFVLYYRAMHGDEEAEAELKHYAKNGAAKDAVRKALENIKDALGIATDLVEELVDIVDGDDEKEEIPDDNGKYTTLDEGLNFSGKAAEHMKQPERQVPVQILQDAIRKGNSFPDPRGSKAMMYYSTMYKTGKLYNLEVLYEVQSNTVYHFKYTRAAIGNLPAIEK